METYYIVGWHGLAYRKRCPTLHMKLLMLALLAKEPSERFGCGGVSEVHSSDCFPRGRVGRTSCPGSVCAACVLYVSRQRHLLLCSCTGDIDEEDVSVQDGLELYVFLFFTCFLHDQEKGYTILRYCTCVYDMYRYLASDDGQKNDVSFLAPVLGSRRV